MSAKGLNPADAGRNASYEASEQPAAGAPDVTPVRGLYDPALDKDSCGVGFIADIKGRKSHKIIEDALTILVNLEHRGAVGADPRAGDGAGLLAQIPHKFFAKKTTGLGFALPRRGHYAVGVLFMPHDEQFRRDIKDVYVEEIARAGMTLIGWRDVPTDNATLGVSVKPTEPVHQQVFIGRGKKIKSEDEFERRLYILRKAISQSIYGRRERRVSGYYPV
jgi:glutamate synthase (NADPH) large chain